MTHSRTQAGASLERALLRVVAVERDEIAGVLCAFAYFFSVLCAYYIVRPLRDEMGVTVGGEGLQRLFLIVFFVMVAAVPVFGWVVSTFPRRQIVPVIYGFFVANLLAFWALFHAGGSGTIVAGTLFVWVSVFNLFVVSLFWILMSDLYRSDQAKRLYGFIAAGGSAGALAGPLATQSLVTVLGANNLLLVSAALLCVATASAMVLRRLFSGVSGGQGEERPVGKGLLAGAVSVWRSPYLLRIAAWILLANLIGTLFYLEQARIVGEAGMDRTQRVQLFARIDFAVSVLTILSQVFLTGRVMQRVGVGATIAVLPVSALLGLAALAVAPTLAVIVTIIAVERAIAFSLANPGMKVLYTVVEPEEKYKAQNFNDTVVFRGGDALAGWVFNTGTKSLGLGLAATAVLAIPAALAWLGLSLTLGREQSRRAAAERPGAAP